MILVNEKTASSSEVAVLAVGCFPGVEKFSRYP